jgi:hypothetical protein
MGRSRMVRKRGLVTFAILVVTAEVAGRSLTPHVDRLFHVEPLAPKGASYYPFLLVGVKVVGALAVAALFARGLRVWAAADAGNRLLTALGRAHERRSPRLCSGVSPRIWLASFVVTSVLYLVHIDADGMAQGRWPLLAPWLHTYALPVFAVLAMAIALVWRFASWLYEVEEYAVRTFARVQRIIDAALEATSRGAYARATDDTGPRRRFGLSFESRPPPVCA